MTLVVPLNPTASKPIAPSFTSLSLNPSVHLFKVIQAIIKAKRIVVICGAGISVQAGIPDFRSSDGLFKTLKRDNPREVVSSGKELFDASVFSAENTTSLFYQMIAQLSDLSQAAEPTSFHRVLRALDDRGRLLRVYTQNIDAIEQKSGLSFGVPQYDGKRAKSRLKDKSKQADQTTPTHDMSSVASTSRLPSPPAETPRCIPLHGTLQLMHCQICNHSYPLLEYIPALTSGQPPQCPECTSLEETRQLVGKRPRGVGRLRPSVVLYNETHKDGEGVGNVVQKDLIGSSKGKGRSGADLLLVVGTSLRVPGTKRMVREFAKAVRSRGTQLNRDSPTPSGLATPVASPRRSPTTDEEPSPKAIYLNLDFPVPTREWEGVFDVWIQGDAQRFADLLQSEIDREIRTKEAANEKKRKREEDSVDNELSVFGRAQERIKTKSHNAPESPANKRRKSTAFPPSPPDTPTVRPAPRLPAVAFGPPKLTIRIGPGLKPHIVLTPRWLLPRSSPTPSPQESSMEGLPPHSPSSPSLRRRRDDGPARFDSLLPLLIKPLAFKDRRGHLITQPPESFERTPP